MKGRYASKVFGMARREKPRITCLQYKKLSQISFGTNETQKIKNEQEVIESERANIFLRKKLLYFKYSKRIL